MNTPSTQPPSHPEAPKGTTFRTAIFLALAGVALLGGYKYIKRHSQESILDSIDRIIESKLKGKNRGIRKMEIRMPKDLRLKMMREKMKPLKLSVSEDVIAALNQFSQEKAALLDSVMVVIDDEEAKKNDGEYFGRIKIRKDGQVMLDAQGEYHLIIIKSNEAIGSPLKLATTLAHEIYGHAFESRDAHTEKSTAYKGSLKDQESLLKYVQTALPFLLEEEFKAFYEESRFLDWSVQNNNSLWTGYLKDHVGEDNAFNHDFPLHEEYAKAVQTGDWTEFKRTIATSYILSQEHLRLAFYYCYMKYKDEFEPLLRLQKTEKPGIRPSKRLMRKFLNKFIEILIKENSINLCLEKDAKDLINPLNPNIPMTTVEK